MNSKECCHSLEFTFILCKAREVQISAFLTACLLFFLLLNVFMFRENLFIPCVYLMRSTHTFSVKLLTCESHPHQTYILNTDAIDPWFWVSGQNWEWKGFLFPFMFTNQSVNLLFYFLKSLFELLLFVLKQFIGSLLLFDTSLVPHTLHISPMRNCRRVWDSWRSQQAWRAGKDIQLVARLLSFQSV